MPPILRDIDRTLNFQPPSVSFPVKSSILSLLSLNISLSLSLVDDLSAAFKQVKNILRILELDQTLLETGGQADSRAVDYALSLWQ